jgi:two-component system, sensor histidine kinase YesM
MKYFDNFKFKSKIKSIILFQTIMIVVIGVIGFYIIISMYRDKIYKQTTHIVKLLTGEVDNKLKRIDKFSFEILSNNEIQVLLKTINEAGVPYEAFLASNRLRDKILQYSFVEDYICSIGIIDGNDKSYIEGIGRANMDQEQIEKILATPKVNGGSVVWIEPENSSDNILAVRCIREIKDISLKKLGLLVIQINKSKLIENNFNYFLKDSYYFAIASDDTIILEEDNKIRINPLDLKIGDISGNYIRRIDGKNYYISFNTSDYTGWKLIFALPYERIMLQITKILIIIILCCLAAFVLITYIGITFSGKLIMPLERLTSKMSEAKEEWFKKEEYADYLQSISFINNGNKDEIGFLENDFKLLVNQINHLLKENYDRQIKVKEWQLKALQSQINPHFLYNTLESIHWMAKANNQEDISSMVKSLGRLLRNSIYKADFVISIGEEIEVLKEYINIQKYRFGERLSVNFTIEEDLLELKIPNLTIQPIVENSINYALEVMLENCVINILACKSGEDIRLVVEDNGPGVDSLKLSKLKKMEVEASGSGIGLKNIDDRIKNIFGDGYGLDIESKQGEGFRVEVHIPLKKEVI